MPVIKQCKRCFKPMARNPQNKHIQKQKFIFYAGQEIGTDYCELCYKEITEGKVI